MGSFRWLKIALLLVVVVSIAYYFSKDEVGLKEGAIAPSFRLPSSTGLVSLDEYRKKKIVLINFWATWCPPCVQEMPSLENLKKMMEGKDFELLAINIDEDNWVAIRRFEKRVPVTMPILVDPEGQVASLYGVEMLPQSFLISKEGKILRRYVGPRNWVDPSIVKEMTRDASMSP